MSTTFTVKGRVVVLQKASLAQGRNVSWPPDRFEAARGKADMKWRTQDLMALLRG